MAQRLDSIASTDSSPDRRSAVAAVSVDGNESAIPSALIVNGPRRQIDIPSRLSSDQFSDYAAKLLPVLDLNGDKFVDHHEMGTALQSDSFKGKDAQAVAGLYALVRAAKRPIGYKELQEIPLHKSAADTWSTSYWLNRWTQRYPDGFAEFSGNGKYIDRQQIEKLLRQHPGDLKSSALSILSERFDEIKQASNDEWFAETRISKKDIARFVENAQKPAGKDPWQEPISRMQQALGRTARAQFNGESRNLYGTDNPLASISADAIQQGMVSNCYFLAALGSVAISDPQSIVDMIRDRKDGWYDVTFPGEPETVLSVKAPTLAEQGIYNGATGNGIWASVLEKAYGEYKMLYEFADVAVPTEITNGGGYSSTALWLLTGRNAESMEMKFHSEDEIHRWLSKRMSGDQHQPVTAHTSPKMEPELSPDGFSTWHVFTVRNYDPVKRTVTVRDPTSDSSLSPQGTMSISLAKIKANFDSLYSAEPIHASAP